MDIKLEDTQQPYVCKLTRGEDAKQTKMDELETLRSNLVAYISERDRLVTEDQAFENKLQSLDSQCAKLELHIENVKQANVSLQEKLARVSFFSFAKKKEIKTQIEINKKKIFVARNEMDLLTSHKSDLLKTQKAKELELSKSYAGVNEGIVTIKDKILLLEKNILEISKRIEFIENEIEHQKQLIETEKKTIKEVPDNRGQEKLQGEIAEEQLVTCLKVNSEKKIILQSEFAQETSEPAVQQEKLNEDYEAELTTHRTKECKTQGRLYYRIYDLFPQNYAGVKVDSLGFSTRLANRLIGNGYKTVEELLRTNDDILGEISGFGKGCFEELYRYFEMLSAEWAQESSKKTNNVEMPAELFLYREQIIHGDFSFADMSTLSVASISCVNRFREAYAALDFGLIHATLDGNHEVLKILKMLDEFAKQIEDKKRCAKLIQDIAENRLNEDVSWLIKCFTDSETMLEYLRDLMTETEQTLKQYLFANAEKISSNERRLENFVKWCQFDLENDMNCFFAERIKNDRELQVIHNRSEGETLEAIGVLLGITRERVRQIEKKVYEKFNIWQKHNRIIFKIFIEMNEKVSLSSMEIMDFLGEHGQEFVHMMKNCETDEILYDKQLDMFFIEDLSLVEKIQSYVESLPDTFPERKLAKFLQIAEREHEYPPEIVLATIEESYRKTEDIYHRFRLSLTSVYADVMKRFYSGGLHVYDKTEIEHFRQLVYSEYGIDLSNKSDHAIGAILSKIGILCGKGMYKYRQNEPYISKELAKRIYDYIENTPVPIFMTNTLFSIFEDELVSEGIDNKYFLQGILRDLYEDKWIFRRDYVVKENSYTSIYSSIVGFIRNSHYPISKEDLYNAFPGVTEIVINLSVADPNILNLFGQYIHSCKLKLTVSDRRYFKDTVDSFLNRKSVCHCKEIYEYISTDYPVLLTNNFVHHAFSLYSLLEYLFRDEYNFSRPFVAQENATIEKAADVLREIVRESERIEISELQAFAKKHHLQVNRILELIDSYNDTHLLINNMEIASLEYIGATKEIAMAIEASIIAEIERPTPIHQLQTLHALPKINIEWNAWLIYSVLKKWSTQLEVSSSARQFRQSYPVVAPLGKLELEMDEASAENHEGSIVMADDLSEIDELIGEYLVERLEDLNGL